MSHINNREFFDEFDNLFQLKSLVKKQRYKNSFTFLYTLFFNDHKQRITVKELQENLGIYDRSIAWQILESFRIMNLLTLEKRLNKGIYSPVNEQYWDVCHKELNKKPKVKGSKK